MEGAKPILITLTMPSLNITMIYKVLLDKTQPTCKASIGDQSWWWRGRAGGCSDKFESQLIYNSNIGAGADTTVTVTHTTSQAFFSGKIMLLH